MKSRKVSMFTMRHALIVALAAGAVACGGAADDPDPGVTTSIGPSGGTVSHPDGVTLEIPAGALTSPRPISITSGGWSLAGTRMYLFQPADLTFEVDAVVTVTFPFDPAVVGTTNASVYWTRPGTTAYDALPTTVAGNTARARVTHFSWGHAGDPCTADASCGPANTCKVGLSACTAGTQTCVETGNAEDGIACSTGFCSDGTCINACHSLGLSDVTPVSPEYLDTTAPVAQGGTVADGTYFLVAVNSYGVPKSVGDFQAKYVVTGDTVQATVTKLGVGGTDRWNATLDFPGTTPPTLTLTPVCGLPLVLTRGYTVAGAELRLMYEDEGNIWEEIFVRQ